MDFKKLNLWSFILLAIALLFMCGCAGSGGLVPVNDVMINEAGDIVEKTAGYTKDASIAKETAVLNAHNLRTSAKLKAYSSEGFKLKWVKVEKTYFFPGMEKPLTIFEQLPEVSYKAPLVFAQALPMEPSKHPVWGLAGKVTDGVFSLGGTWVKWYFGSEVAKNALDSSQIKYYGDYNPQTAAPYVVEPTVIQP